MFVAKCIDDDDWESCAPLIRGLPAAHNERDRKTTASVTSLPETSRVVLQSSPAQNALLRRIRMCRVRFVSKDVHSTTRVDVEAVRVAALQRRGRGRNDNDSRLVLPDRETTDGRNRYRGIRGVGVECLWCQAFQRRSWPLFRRVYADWSGRMSGGRVCRGRVDGMIWRCWGRR